MHHRLLFLALCSAGALLAATAGSDSAANYAGDGFTNGANQGTGFQSWTIFAEGSGGNWIGDSTFGCGDINTSGKSFGMWGNPGGNNFIRCYRKFAGGALSAGQKFTCRITVNWRSGYKGLEVLSSGSAIFKTEVGNFGSGDDYTYSVTNASNKSLGWGWGEKSIIDCAFEQKTGNVLGVSLTRGTDVFTQDFTLPAPADEFQLFCGSTDGGDNNNFFANSMVVIPEPASLLALALGVGLLARARR